MAADASCWPSSRSGICSERGNAFRVRALSSGPGTLISSTNTCFYAPPGRLSPASRGPRAWTTGTLLCAVSLVRRPRIAPRATALQDITSRLAREC